MKYNREVFTMPINTPGGYGSYEFNLGTIDALANTLVNDTLWIPTIPTRILLTGIFS